MSDPAEVLASQPVHPKREETTKSLMDKYPGHIVLASDRASFSGCRLIRFHEFGALGLESDDEAIFAAQCREAGIQLGEEGMVKDGAPFGAEGLANLYFSKRGNLLVVNQMVDDGELVLFITTQLDDEDLEELQEVQTRVQIGMREWREKRQAAREEAAAAIREERRLIEVGRNYEANVSKKAEAV